MNLITDMKLLRGTMRVLTILFLLMMKGMDGPPLTERPNTGQQVIINTTAGENKQLITKDESAQKDILSFQWFFRKANTTKEVTYCQDMLGKTEIYAVNPSYSGKVERCNATSILLKNISSHDEGYYILQVLKNDDGKAENFTILLSVSGVPQPVQVTSHRDSPGSTSYQLMWDIPDDGGSPLIKYILQYCEVEIKPNGTEYELSKPLSQLVTVEISPSDVSYTLSSLKPGSYYQVEVQAVNTVGTSSKRFIFKTKETPDNHGSNWGLYLFFLIIPFGLLVIYILYRKNILTCARKPAVKEGERDISFSVEQVAHSTSQRVEETENVLNQMEQGGKLDIRKTDSSFFYNKTLENKAVHTVNKMSS